MALDLLDEVRAPLTVAFTATDVGSAPFCLIVTTGLAFLYPQEDQNLFNAGSLRRIDFLGSFLLLTATVLMIFGLQQAGSLTFAWDSIPILLSFGIAAISFVFFCIWETRLSWKPCRIEPVFPLRLAGKRVYLACLMYANPFLAGLSRH